MNIQKHIFYGAEGRYVAEVDFDRVTAERDTLRTKLAEAQALLSRASTDLEHIQKECAGDVTPGYIGCLVDDVVDLLSASAEPSAPVCETCDNQGAVGSTLNAEPCPDCSYSAPVERDEFPPFAKTVIKKLKRFRDCAEDNQGADIGKVWFDVLVQLGLLNRVQRSPAYWEITDEGVALLESSASLERKP